MSTVSPVWSPFLRMVVVPKGTTAAATHLANSRVTSNPTFPRFRIKKAIQDSVLALRVAVQCPKYTFASDATVVVRFPANTSAVFDVGG